MRGKGRCSKNRRQGGVDFWDLCEKVVKNGGYTHFEHFLGIGGISGENGVPYWPPRQCKPAEKTVHLPSGVISEVLPRVDFALPACLGPKSTLGRTSEMTPEGRCTVFTGNAGAWGVVPQGGARW